MLIFLRILEVSVDFDTKYDWLYILLMVVLAVVVLFASNIFLIGGYWYFSIFMVGILFFVFYLFLWTSITLSDTAVVVRIGFFKRVISYMDIKEIKCTKNILSSFATSISRIGIRTSDKTGILHFVYISPKKSDEFLEKLKENVKEDVVFTGFDTK